MNLAKLTIDRRVFASFLTTLLCVWGLMAYYTMGKLEDPIFTVKTAAIVTLYPGASAREVEQYVTDPVERKLEEMEQLWKLRSLSRPGQSMVFVDLYDSVDSADLPQQWDLLRRKVNDIKLELPATARLSIVLDEFSDVYGIVYAISGEGMEMSELKQYARALQRDLKAVDGVKKVALEGLPQPVAYIEIDDTKIAAHNLTSLQVIDQLRTQNMVLPGGALDIGMERIRIDQKGPFKNVDDIGNTIIRGGIGNIGDDLVLLRDIADIRLGYQEPVATAMRFNGKPAITIAVTPRNGINVVAIGDTLKATIDQALQKMPAGVEIGTIAFQPDEVARSVSNFISNLAQSILIVVAVLCIFMGWRSASVVGASLLITILLTLVYMQLQGIDLHRVSVGTFIIALGMLVDNAIVVTDLFLSNLRRGMERTNAAAEAVKNTAIPLLAATVIAIASASPILFSKTAAAEFAGDLFYIMGSSLLLSWVIATTITPLLCWRFLPAPEGSSNTAWPAWVDRCRPVLDRVLRNRKLTVGALFTAIALTGLLVSKMLVNFMPPSDRPLVFLDYWLPEGGRIEQVSEDMANIEQWLLQQEGITSISTFIGSSAPRFSVTVEPEPLNKSYGQIVINVDQLARIKPLILKGDAWLKENFPHAEPRFRPIKLATADKFSIEARFSGPDPQILREISSEAKAIMTDHPNMKYIRDDWRQPVKVLAPEFNQEKARLAGVTRLDVAVALQRATSGVPVSILRNGDEQIPVMVRSTAFNRALNGARQQNDINRLMTLPVRPLIGGYSVPLGQVVDGFAMGWEESMIWRRNRKPTITVQADVDGIFASQARSDIAEAIENMDLPEGYDFAWGGEYYEERRAVNDILMQVPKAGVIMIIIMIAMFNGFRQPGVIMLTLPMALIGVVPILILSAKPFGFMALVGLIALAGMIIKNGIVLMDQINLELKNGAAPYEALCNATLNRTLAISMAALTTALGMVPLWTDPLFDQMAATIIGGLVVATILTLLIMPVFYAIFYQVPAPAIEQGNNHA
nr:efflux RND transporter permease subunit [Endozoicomonas sp.]